MVKTLRVIEPFFVMEVGDMFEWNDDTQMYVSTHAEEFHKSHDDDSEINSTYNSNFSISAGYADDLIKEGYLETVDTDAKKNFVNVFDEIDAMKQQFQYELDHLDEDCQGIPACLKTEKLTVLTNLLTTLNHLSNLKK
jgi:hypothetical protein